MASIHESDLDGSSTTDTKTLHTQLYICGLSCYETLDSDGVISL
jgi:hypothetical protein